GRLPPVSSRPSGRTSRTRAASSPVELPGALVKRLGHALLDGLAHPRNGKQVKRFLDGLPVLRGEQDGARALARDVDGLMGLGVRIDEAVQVGPCFGSGERGHCGSPSMWITYALAYVASMLAFVRWSQVPAHGCCPFQPSALTSAA